MDEGPAGRGSVQTTGHRETVKFTLPVNALSEVTVIVDVAFPRVLEKMIGVGFPSKRIPLLVARHAKNEPQRQPG
jgi:hypothetical protein